MLFNKIQITDPFPFIGKAALRGIGNSLNFSIINLCSAKIRRDLFGSPVEDAPVDVDPLLAKYGKTLDQRNTEDEARRGREHEDAQRQEQGFTVVDDPLELAGYLLVIRNAIGLQLNEHARRLTSPLLNGATYLDPFETLRTLDDELMRQLTKPVLLNEEHLRAQAKQLRISLDQLKRITIAQQNSGIRFLKERKNDLLAFFETLTAYRPALQGEESRPDAIEREEGKFFVPYDVNEYEDIFTSLPAIRQAGMYRAAVQGLKYEHDRWTTMLIKGHSDAMGNRDAIFKKVADIRAEYDRLCKQPKFAGELNMAIEKGATRPVLPEIEVYKDDEVAAA